MYRYVRLLSAPSRAQSLLSKTGGVLSYEPDLIHSLVMRNSDLMRKNSVHLVSNLMKWMCNEPEPCCKNTPINLPRRILLE